MDVDALAEGELYSEELGIDLAGTEDGELFEWFPASYISGDSLVVDGGWTCWR